MKQVLCALMVLIVAAWTVPVFGQQASLLDQVKGKTEAEVVAFMQGLSDEQLASLVADAVNAAAAEPGNAAVVALRDLTLKAAGTVLAAKPAEQRSAIVAAIQAAAPGTTIGKDASGALAIVPPPLPAAPQAAAPGVALADPAAKQTDVNELREKEVYDSEAAGR
ncbi:MAG: hypothetical protein GX945_04820 [Lentisphaerae bacterium]|nr:hypothetical protein [Lentisphaerota bacterium]